MLDALIEALANTGFILFMFTVVPVVLDRTYRLLTKICHKSTKQ